MGSHSLKERFEKLLPFLDERTKRLFVAVEASVLGWGGRKIVHQETGVSYPTIAKGIEELRESAKHVSVEAKEEKLRKPGGGRKRISEKWPELKEELEKLVEPLSRGDPESPLRWTCKSTRKLSEELKQRGYRVSHTVVGGLLREMGYSLQANVKVREGSNHVDRNGQFEYLNRRVQVFQSRNHPVISVDTKKKELIGDFKNGGREYRPKGRPEKVRVHDFVDKKLGKAVPYGVYDVTSNEGWGNVGISHDTAVFAVHSIRQWWERMGEQRYPQAKHLLITADSGGSNGYRLKLWKVELQKLVNDTGLSISVCHLPPGTSKWNKIEHRLFSFITQNWRGKPLVSLETVINLIAATKTAKGLKVHCQLDENTYEKGIQVPDEQMEALNILKEDFPGEWNYTFFPQVDRD